ncbi:cupin domain-containing protein [Mycobacterium sp.]|uniref:cupin domain-containing protein n=1 Tax=Mycobacterium sp. TaxID=1785 RepID=UPI003C715F60
MLDHDQHMRPGTTAADLAKLAPAFAGIGALGGFDACRDAEVPLDRSHRPRPHRRQQLRHRRRRRTRARRLRKRRGGLGSDPAGPDRGDRDRRRRPGAESFFVLSGTMSLFDGRNWVDSTAGDYLYVPPGGFHGFRNEADEPASILMLFTPGVPREAYFEGLAGLANMTDEQRREFVIGHDNYYV